MYEPTRGGTRGGQAEFKWSDVSADKDRENYLGHSINAPTGRWQKNKDVHWYNRDLDDSKEAREAELRKVKEAEAEAMAQVLGFAPTKKTLDATTSGDKQDVPTTGTVSPGGDDDAVEERLERRRRKMEKKARKEEKKARKEARRTETRRDESDSDSGRHDRYREGRRSPRRRYSQERNNSYRGRRSKLPSRARRRSASPPPRRDTREPREHGSAEQERERERDRRRWDVNTSRDLPRSHRTREDVP